MLYSFKNDYSEGAHPDILQALAQNNLNYEDPYGEDSFSTQASSLIRAKIQQTNAQIHFVTGGTQANIVVISSILRPHQSIIATETGHIAVHETGAIEALGHKINTVITANGKLSVSSIESLFKAHIDEHMVMPKLVFISNASELGSIYKKKELEDISKYCKKKNLYLYLDGARLGSAMAAKDNDLSLADIASLVDVFYIGGTKNGAMFGEAIVILNDELKKDFRYTLKQRGALLAKQRFLGIQFVELFKQDLFLELANHANSMAYQLAEGIIKTGHSFLLPVETNQVFAILPNNIISHLALKYSFHIWEKVDDQLSAIRLVTSWATDKKDCDQFCIDLALAIKTPAQVNLPFAP